MLRVTASTSAEGAKRYFGENLTRSDYYLSGQEITGIWGGHAAERLGLHGTADAPGYFALCENVNPQTGQQLTPRQKGTRRVGYDFTFSAPKPISVLYELSGDERILDAFRASVRETMTEIERGMKTRVRVGGRDEDRVTGNLAYAEFVHFTSRPVNGKPDPHLHAHCFAFNATYDEAEDRWKAGQFGDLKRDADYYEAAFHARFARRLEELGHETERQGTSFGLAALPRSFTDTFSQRRNVIEQEAARRGITSDEGKHAIGYFGREHKSLDLSKAQLRTEWRERLSPEQGAALDRVIAGAERKAAHVSAADALHYAVEHSFERSSAVPESRLTAEALRYGVGSVSPEEIDCANDRSIIRHQVDGRDYVTTVPVLQEEVRMLDFARSGRGRFLPFGESDGALRGLNHEQRSAALHVLRSKDQVTGIRGGAGTGKTHMMRATIAAIETSGGRRVFVFAPSSQASRTVLRNEGFANAETVEHLLKSEQMQRQVRGQVLWIDEAGMLGSRDTARIFDLAKRQECRVILSGDYRQHSSVNRGDSFRLLESEAGIKFAQLKQIRRQEKPWYRRAVEAISRGTGKDAAAGFDRLQEAGAIVELTGAERHRALVNDYLEAVADKKSALVIAPTHSEGRQLTGEIRQALKEHRVIGERDRAFITRTPTHWTEAQRRDARNYEPGQVVQFHQNVAGTRKRMHGDRRAVGGFTRGDTAIVTGRDGAGVWVLRTDGTAQRLPLEQAARFQVYTTHELPVTKGDRLRITLNGFGKPEAPAATFLRCGTDRGKRLNNGDVVTVQGFTRDGDIRLEGGGVLPKSYGHFAHGYTETSHAAQGKGAQRVFIAVGDDSLKAANRAQWYVSVSRGREAVKVYTADAEALREAIQRSPERMSAVEMTRGERPRLGLRAFAFERQRVAQYLRNRVRVIAERVRAHLPHRELSYGRG